MKKHKIKSTLELSKLLGLSPADAFEAELKAELMDKIEKQIKKLDLTHQEAADLSGVGRTVITGIVNYSIQRITIDRLVKVLVSLGVAPKLSYRSVEKDVA